MFALLAVNHLFGKIFLQYLNQRQLVLVYILGGLSGALVYLLAYNLFPVFQPEISRSVAIGASASVMAIVAAIAFRVPNYTLYLFLIGRVRIVYLAIALFVFDFFMIPGSNSGGHLAHIGGALFGFAWAQPVWPAFGRKFSALMSMGSAASLFRKKKMRASPGSGSARPVSDEEYNMKRAEHQRRIDSILEKISRGGYESLTREEKELLFLRE